MFGMNRDSWLEDGVDRVVDDTSLTVDYLSSSPSSKVIISNIENFHFIDPRYFLYLNPIDSTDILDELYSGLCTFRFCRNVPYLERFEDRFRYIYLDGDNKRLQGLALGKVIDYKWLPLYSYFYSDLDKALFDKLVKNANEN